MPTTEEVRAILENDFSNIEEYRPTVLRAERRLRGQTAAIGYFDYGENLPRDIGSLRAYQEDLLGEEYFRLKSSLQWNLYLYLVVTSEGYRRLARANLLEPIQADPLYARKFVVRMPDLLEELRGPQLLTQGSVAPSDFLEAWDSKLRITDLSDLLDGRVPVAKVLDRYLEGRSPFSPGGEQKLDARGFPSHLPEKSVRRPRMITGIKIKRFRSCLNGQKFEFGPVTLITGPNGSGKTSLLEAVEAWFCGGTQRDQDRRIPEGSIGISFSGNSRYSWNHGTPAEFRARALAWYGVHRARHNPMPAMFRRFNFFWTDASVRFAESHTEADMTDALSNLVIGEEASIAANRAELALDTLRRNLGQLREQRVEFHSRWQASAALLEELTGQATQVAQAKKDFKKRMGVAGWISGAALEDATSILIRVRQLSQAISEFKIRWPRFYNMTQQSVVREAKKLAKLPSKIRTLEDSIEELDKSRLQAEGRHQEVERTLSLLKELGTYVRHKDIVRLEGLSRRINRLDRIIADGERASALVEQAKGLEELPSSDLVDNLCLQIEKRGEQLESDLAISQSKLEAARKAYEQATQLVSRIRENAKELLSVDPTVETCPLCGTPHEKGQLARKLQEQLRGSSATDLVKLEARVSELRDLQRPNQTKLDVLKQLQSFLSSSSGTSRTRPSLEKAIEQLKTLRSGIAEKKRERRKLQEASGTFQQAGLTELRYGELRKWFKSNYPSDESTPAAVERITGAVISRRDKIGLADLQQKLNIAINEASGLLGPYSAHDTGVGPLAALEEAIDGVKEHDKLLNHSQELATIDGPLRLSTAATRLREIEQVISEAQHNYTSLPSQTDALRRKTAEAEKLGKEELERIDARIRRANGAISLLKALVEGESSKTAYVEDFVQSDVSSIGKLFRYLSAPREFADIAFVGEKGEIQPIRAVDGSPCSIMQMSSNQRSALAISVFLSMNARLSAGPPYILLDDPVAHSDDLNTLSLFDYLRLLVATDERQIVFATASRKVALLFRRKMEVLGKDFYKEINMHR